MDARSESSAKQTSFERAIIIIDLIARTFAFVIKKLKEWESKGISIQNSKKKKTQYISLITGILQANKKYLFYNTLSSSHTKKKYKKKNVWI